MREVMRWRVPFSDCTVGDHVYYSRYLDWFERARDAALRRAGIPFRTLMARGILLPVVSASLRYHRPARYDDEVGVELEIPRPRRPTRLLTRYRVVRTADAALLVEGTTEQAAADDRGRPMRLPADLVEALTAAFPAEDDRDGPGPRPVSPPAAG